MGISRHPILPWVSSFFGTIFLGFGCAYMLWPREAFPTFGFPSPTTPADLELMDAVMVLYGVKDIFVGVAILAATWLGNRKTAGVLLVAGSFCAGVDGYVVNRFTGTGEWNHCGYGSVMGVIGLLVMGLLG
ncbi:hypothetical protein K458DRAFT_484526 [Lentithecium fluviatile CBS 122367]|uniref:Uncharacterized protein n=1 Tax=Lentithecium fluviatile CBS 122367 TaxID=1168545 RepID=A0A6G1JDC8_9PLEO|nr:hypothetical protein K458DRAFT_484526 [Lentithecium fluviatile CBS 122367]